MNYGTIRIVDGPYQPDGRFPTKSVPSNGFARMEIGSDGSLSPTLVSAKPSPTTLIVDLYYNNYAYLYAGQKAPLISSVYAGYSKSIKRLSTGGNPVGSATRLVAELAGCDEAKKVRGRAIALSRIRKTISEEVFRFRLGGQ